MFWGEFCESWFRAVFLSKPSADFFRAILFRICIIERLCCKTKHVPLFWRRFRDNLFIASFLSRPSVVSLGCCSFKIAFLNVFAVKAFIICLGFQANFDKIGFLRYFWSRRRRIFWGNFLPKKRIWASLLKNPAYAYVLKVAFEKICLLRQFCQDRRRICLGVFHWKWSLLLSSSEKASHAYVLRSFFEKIGLSRYFCRTSWFFGVFLFQNCVLEHLCRKPSTCLCFEVEFENICLLCDVCQDHRSICSGVFLSNLNFDYLRRKRLHVHFFWGELR